MAQKKASQPAMEIADRVIRTVSSHFGIRKSDLDHSSDLQELGADLLDRIELMVTIEEEFDISVPLEDAREIRTADDIVKLVHTSLHRKNKKHN